MKAKMNGLIEISDAQVQEIMGTLLELTPNNIDSVLNPLKVFFSKSSV